MAIVRIKKNRGFTVMSNYHLQDPNLSLKAKGLLSYMLSLRDDWVYSISGFACVCKEGKDAIRSAIQELENAHYVIRFQTHKPDGSFGGNEYMVYELPQEDTAMGKVQPLSENPTTVDPTTGNPLTENPTQINTNQTSTNSNNPLSEIRRVLSGLTVKDDDRAANMVVMSALEAHGYLCQNEVPVPSRGDRRQYTGRVGIIATKDGFTAGIEVDRCSIRKKTLYKLREYPCDVRIVLLRGGNQVEPPDGIDAVIPLKLENLDDFFHEFWDVYPKKVDKKRAYEVFRRLNVTPELLCTMIRAVENQKRSEQWCKASGQYIPHAATWLNGRRWEDNTTAEIHEEYLPEPEVRNGWR